MPDLPTSMPAESTKPAPYLSCSDCREPMRAQYYAMNDRPVCAKCRPVYARRIERTDGRGAMLRVGLQGALVALIGTIVLAGAIAIFPPLRLFVVVPIGYYVGKRMMTALDGYSARRYQYVAVSLTYLCFLIGFAVPAGVEQRKTAARRAEVRAKMQNTMATQADALQDELAASGVALDAAPGDDSEDTDAAARTSPAGLEPNIAPGPGLAFVMFLLFPFIASLQFGLAYSAVGFTSIGYALYQAWTRTDGQGLRLQLKGPFRVGHGPIR